MGFSDMLKTLKGGFFWGWRGRKDGLRGGKNDSHEWGIEMKRDKKWGRRGDGGSSNL